MKINFEWGAAVAAGGVLIQLDTATEESQLRAAEVRFEPVPVNMLRAKALRPTNAVSQSDIDNWIYQ